MPVAAGVVEVVEAAEVAEAAEVEAAEAAEAAAAACRGDLAASASALDDWQNVSPRSGGAFRCQHPDGPNRLPKPGGRR